MKSELVNDHVETHSLLMDESRNNWSNNITNLLFFFKKKKKKILVTSNFVSLSSLDDDKLELFEWYEGFSIRISIIKKQ